jgi:hypothetical protein
MSWEDIEKEEQPKEASQEQVDRFCLLCNEVFCMNEQGKELLNILSNHLNTPVCPPDKESSYGYFREGQNNIIRQLVNAISYHQNKVRASNE